MELIPEKKKDLTQEERREVVEYMKKGSLRKRRGLRLYSWDPSNGEILEVEMDQEVRLQPNGKTNKRWVVKNHSNRLIYFQKLNMRNAKEYVIKIIKKLTAKG